jgi:formylglycine-generating enzyme required for sulfatase activity
MNRLSFSFTLLLGACIQDLQEPSFGKFLERPDEDFDRDGYTELAGDENDDDADIYPGASELCDGKDNDQDGEVDEDAVDGFQWFKDADGDGFADQYERVDSCEEELAGYIGVDEGELFDCDDGDDDIHPGNARFEALEEGCFADTDGDGWGDSNPPSNIDEGMDCDDSDEDIFPGSAAFEDSSGCFSDADGDGYGDLAAEAPYDAGSDCDDGAAAVFPGSLPLEGLGMCSIDVDGDGYGDALAEAPFDPGSDCDDQSAGTFPGAAAFEDSAGCFRDLDGDGHGDHAASSPFDAGHDCDDSTSLTHPGSLPLEGPTKCAQDSDGDGYGDASAEAPFDAGSDCDDSNAGTHPGSAFLEDSALCFQDLDGDGWGEASPSDGIEPGMDCDDDDEDVFPGAAYFEDSLGCYLDADGDGYGSATAGDGYGVGGDCDDNSADTYPGSAYFEDSSACYEDLDGDGYGSSSPAAGFSIGGDCDDSSTAIFPGSAYFEDSSGCYQDLDGDGYGTTVPPSGFATGRDCDDGSVQVNPDAPERCFDSNGAVDGADNNCDGEIDEGTAIDATQWYLDADGDGFGSDDTNLPQVRSCASPDYYVINNLDCNDASDSISPGSPEYCDEQDNDCNGETDEGIGTSAPVDAPSWYQDVDGDGYGDAENSERSCTLIEGYLADGSDCNDNNPARYPGAEEECNGSDDNCDGDIDEEGSIDASVWYMDADGDGYGDPDVFTSACDQPEAYLSSSDDCDDGDASVHPGLLELCDGVDQDCDGSIDEDPTDPQIWYADADGDGYGDPATFSYECSAPEGYVEGADDCDDGLVIASPDAVEICDGIDNDCDGLIDDEDDSVSFASLDAFYADADGDGFGSPGNVTYACQIPDDHVIDSSDCDDSDDKRRPGEPERCNLLDDDCDGTIDEEAINPVVFYPDADGDGYGVDGADTLSTCFSEGGEAPGGYAILPGDCDDEVDSIYPTALELCTESVDENCDGNSFLGAVDPTPWYADIDEDGYGNSDYEVIVCAQPNGYVDNDEDCDDRDAEAYPGTPELCNGKWDNCGSSAELVYDEDTKHFTPLDEWDDDGDGYVECSPQVDLLLWESSQVAFIQGGNDCDDERAFVYPSADEICNGQYDDCSLRSPDSSAPSDEWDDDGDDYIECLYVPSDEWFGQDGILEGQDCNDLRADTHPGVIPEQPLLCVQDSDGDLLADCVFSTFIDEYAGCDFGLFLDEEIGMDFVTISDLESPLDNYKLSHRFEIATTEVTQEFYGALSPGYLAYFPSCGVNCPADNLSWHQAAQLANLLSDTIGLEQCYDCIYSDSEDIATLESCAQSAGYPENEIYECPGYRLPTEGEWELAARSGTEYSFWTPDGGGNNSTYICDAQIQDGVEEPLLYDYANFNQCDGSITEPVGSRLPNGFGLYDVHGNVWEWGHDRWGTRPSEYSDPVQLGENSYGLIRGGSWNDHGSNSQLGHRNYTPLTNNANGTVGFRLARTVNTPPSVPAVRFGSRPLDVSQPLHCQAEAEDVDGDEIDYVFQWRLDGADYEGDTEATLYVGDTIPVDLFAYGDVWTCMAHAEDGQAQGESSSATVRIEGAHGDYTLYTSEEDTYDFVRITDRADPLTRYHLLDEFYLLSTEVTQELYIEFVGSNPSYFHGCDDPADCDGLTGNPNHPVESLYWREAAHFANLLSLREGLDSCYDCTYTDPNRISTMSNCVEKAEYADGLIHTCSGYRLPTNAEWELAARSGSGQNVWTVFGGGYSSIAYGFHCVENALLSDGSLLEDYAWNYCQGLYHDNGDGTIGSNSTQSVGELLANGFGLHDMTGNVWEWLHDPYSTGYDSSISPVNPGDSSTNRAIRGGAYNSTPNNMNAGANSSQNINGRNGAYGFRIARTVDDSPPLPPTVSIREEAEGLHCEMLQAAVDDHEEPSYTIAWTFDGQSFDGTTETVDIDGDRIPPSELAEGDWGCTVQAHDSLFSSLSAQATYSYAGEPAGFSIGFGHESGMSFVRVEAGSDLSESYTLTRDFYLSDAELTQGVYLYLMGENISNSTSLTCGHDCPMNYLTWHMSAAVANALSDLEGRAACYDCSWSDPEDAFTAVCDSLPEYDAADIYDCPGYRLPTEAEWQLAAYAGEDTTYSGSNIYDDVAQYSSGSIGSYAVYSQQSNAWGFYGLTGNASEWCHDREPSSFPSTPEDPVGTLGDNRALRGGAWNTTSVYPDTRTYLDPTTYRSYHGFHPQDIYGVRLAITAE